MNESDPNISEVTKAMDVFALRVSYICGLEQNNKMSTDDAFERIKFLWKKLKKFRKQHNVPEVEEVDIDIA